METIVAEFQMCFVIGIQLYSSENTSHSAGNRSPKDDDLGSLAVEERILYQLMKHAGKLLLVG